MAGRVWQAIPRWAEPLVVALSKLGVSACVLRSGFSALSDDDYSRLVIAQGFADAPKLDPSGTSWLPLPFWIWGSAFALFGREIAVARAVALALGAGAMLLVWAAARVLGASRPGALLAALLASVFPYSAWLGAATLPEVFCSALIVFGAATLFASSTRSRALGALALAAACFCRYEAWPAALVFAVFTAIDAARGRRRDLAALALFACAPIALWLLHGAVVHKNALFFVDRVTAYRQALGGPEAHWAARLVWYPLALLRFEPELIALVVVALVTARVLRGRIVLLAHRRLWLCLLAVLVFLTWGSLRGGVPTHHAERTLLSLWFGCALLCGDVLGQAVPLLSPRGRLALVFAGLLELGGGVRLRPYVAEREAFANRDAEFEIGREARLLGASELVVDTDDYGYFATIASFGQPAHATPLFDHDPRKAANQDFDTALAAKPAGTWLVMPRRKARLGGELGQVIARNEAFVLVKR